MEKKESNMRASWAYLLGLLLPASLIRSFRRMGGAYSKCCYFRGTNIKFTRMSIFLALSTNHAQVWIPVNLSKTFWPLLNKVHTALWTMKAMHDHAVRLQSICEDELYLFFLLWTLIRTPKGSINFVNLSKLQFANVYT